MKKYLSIFLLFIFSFSSSYATVIVDNQWDDKINEKEKKELIEHIGDINSEFKLNKFKSKKDLETFLTEKYVKNTLKSCYKYPYYMYDNMMYLDGAMPMRKGVEFQAVNSIEADTAIAKTENLEFKSKESVTQSSETEGGSEIDFTKTNIQKVEVDEPEIVKNTKGYVFYYNGDTKKVYIIKSPVDLEANKIDLDKVEIVAEIKVPSLLQRDIQLFATDDRLVILGTRNKKIKSFLGGVKTDLLVYDISKIEEGKLKIVKLYESNGRYVDARLINGKLYTISNYNLSPFRRELCQRFVFQPLEKEVEAVYNNNDLSYKEKRVEADIIVENYINNNNVAEKIKEAVIKETKQKSLDLSYNPNSKLKYKGKKLPYDFEITTVNKDTLYYIPNDFNANDYYNNNFNIITGLDIDNVRNDIQLNVIWGNISGDNLHMTKDSLYLVNNMYLRTNPIIKGIADSFKKRKYTNGQYTLIHKLKVKDLDLDYINSTFLTGQPINQYSMDEDIDGNFRIFLAQGWSKKDVNLFVLDDKLKFKSVLTNIEPNEQFKSARFIGDKAYLVTFKATDPLFVIDMSNYDELKIIGELKIPGYSLYLHPYGSEEDGIQYLIGIGQEAEEVHGNRSLPKNVKVDLYKIDYNKKIGDYCLEQKDLDSQLKCFDKANIKYNLEEKKVNCECPDGVECLIDCDKLKKDNMKFNITDIKKDKNYNNIFVDQVASKILGNEKTVGGMVSYTTVFDNPRTFVFNPKTKELVLPLILTKTRDVDLEEDGVNAKRMAYYNSKKVNFVGFKILKVDKKENKIEEIFSKNYKEKLDLETKKNDNGYNYDKSPYWYKRFDLRVGQYGDSTYFLNTKFIDFVRNKNNKTINFE